MKYSLRSLMIVVTLVGVVLGGAAQVRRVIYLRYNAKEHRALARQLPEMRWEIGLGEDTAKNNAALKRVQNRHVELSLAYERAVYRPWITIDESKFP